MSTKIHFRWEQDHGGGDQGILTLWPDSFRELRLVVQDFETANTLFTNIKGVTNEAFDAGRRSMQAEVGRIAI